MPVGWIGPAAAAAGGLISVWLAVQHLGSTRRRQWQRLRRMQLTTGTAPPEQRPAPGRSGHGRGLAALRTRGQVRALEQQLEQGLVTMTNSLRAGLSLVQALEVAAEEAEAPLGLDLAAVLDDYRVGRPLEQSLLAWSKRRRSEDLLFFARAIEIHRESGGDLGVVLSSLAQTVRDRRLLRLELAAKTSESRVTAAVLVAMVPVLALILLAFQREMLAPLWQHPLGRLGLGYAVASWSAGAFTAWRLVRGPLSGGAA